jgi:hypothetical protein
MLEHYGAMPDALGQLEDRLARDAMIDPFSGELLVYRPSDEGWTLYSVGPNLIDDGGGRDTCREDLDIVYQSPPEPIEPFAFDDDGP